MTLVFGISDVGNGPDGISDVGNGPSLYPIYIPPLRVGNLKYIISKDKSSNIDIHIHIMYYIKTITKEIDQ